MVDKLSNEQIITIQKAFQEEFNFEKEPEKEGVKKESKSEQEYLNDCLKIAFGRLKWSPYEYYTSSPQEFYYACKGYFDERDENNELMRAVAKFSCAGYVKGSQFDNAHCQFIRIVVVKE